MGPSRIVAFITSTVGTHASTEGTDWNRDWKPVPADVGDVVDRALTAADRYGDRPAVYMPGREPVATRHIPARAAAQAALLADVAGPDTNVVALVGFDTTAVTLSLASAMANRQIALADAKDDLDRLANLVRSLDAVVIADHEHADVTEALPDDIETTLFDATDEADPAGPWVLPPGERWPRVLSTTSGTTGAPKAAILPAKRWHGSKSESDAHRACRLCIAGIGSYAFVADCVDTFSKGTTTAMFDPRSGSMRDIVDYMDACKVTSLGVTSTFTTAAIRATGGKPFANEVTWINLRGERVSGDHIAQARTLGPNAVVSAAYASTEMGGVARKQFYPGEPLPEPGLPVAMDITEGVEVLFVQPDDSISDTPPTNGPVELVVKPKNIFEGYVARDDDKVQIDGEWWFKSGDLGDLTDDGLLRVYGRHGRRVKVGGQFVDLDDVASAFESVEEVALAVVTSFIEERTGATRLVAHVTPTDGMLLDPVAVRASLAERLPIFMVPSLVRVVDDPPMARTGKLDEKLLGQWRPPADEAPRASRHDFSSVTEATLQIIASELLGIPVGPLHDLIDAGMTSLDWIELQTRLRDELSTEVGLTDLYAAPTVRAIARFVDGDLHSAPLVALRRGEQTPSLIWVLLGLGAHEAVPLSRGLRNRTTWVPTPAGDGRPGTVPITPAEIVNDMADRIEACIPSGEPVIVAGFSTGTKHAQALAAHLQANGRDCPLLVLLDPPSPRPRPLSEPLQWLVHQRRRLYRWRHPEAPRETESQRVFFRQRTASTRWNPPAWSGATLLVRSDEFEGMRFPDGLDGAMTTTKIPGGHFDVVAAGEELAAMIESTLDSLG